MEETDTDKLVRALNGVATLGYSIDRLTASIEKLTLALNESKLNGPPESRDERS